MYIIPKFFADAMAEVGADPDPDFVALLREARSYVADDMSAGALLAEIDVALGEAA